MRGKDKLRLISNILPNLGFDEKPALTLTKKAIAQRSPQKNAASSVEQRLIEAPVFNTDVQSTIPLASLDQNSPTTFKNDDELILRMQQELLSARERNRFDANKTTLESPITVAKELVEPVGVTNEFAQEKADTLPPLVQILTPKETMNAHSFAHPSQAEFENYQLHLFQSFLCNTQDQQNQLSNAIDLWDCVPRYSVSRQEMTKARVADKYLEPHRIAFQHRGHNYICIISAAYVTDLDGKNRFYYPSGSEELVEDALRKLAIERHAGYFDKANYRSGVMFTLHALRKEMEKQGHTRSYQQIVQSLNILSHCVIDIVPLGEGEAQITSACLSSLVAVSHKRLKEDPNAKWIVQFHPLVTGAIDQVTHRQYNYQLMMSHSTQLARWLHKQLVLKYTFADQFKPFQMRYSTIKRDSGLFGGYSRDRKAVEMLEAAFEGLKEKNIISSMTRSDETGPRKKLIDVIFTVRPSFPFIRETKAANKRQLMASAKSFVKR